jgi:hypothetical protein
MKLVMCVAFLCVASFAQQSPTIKTASQTSKFAVTVPNSDSQKTLKKVDGVTKPNVSTWTSLKKLFE